MVACYEIELVAFSGRPNPHFALRTQEARRLERMVASTLRKAKRARSAAAPAVLGYRGLVVHVRSADGVWRPWLRLGHDELAVMWGPHAGRYRDDVGLEAWLLEQADRAGLHDVVQAVVPPERRGGQRE